MRNAVILSSCPGEKKGRRFNFRNIKTNEEYKKAIEFLQSDWNKSYRKNKDFEVLLKAVEQFEMSKKLYTRKTLQKTLRLYRMLDLKAPIVLEEVK